jgi:2-polyprenyl-3-methyl-5-hydroxy-6-metoxy-1,4-benzoquinol methylase
MPDFSKRSQELEIMDDLEASGSIIDVTLKELEIINLLLGGNYVTIDGIRKLLKNKIRQQPVMIADLGCGSGDILRLIKKWSLKNGQMTDLTGIDANRNIIEYAKHHTPRDYSIRYESQNIFSEEFGRRTFDIITGTLFFHHFTDEQLTQFFRQLKEKVRIGIVINDIHRHWFAYYSIKWLTGLFSKSQMVKNDAPVSVMRAFSKTDLQRILENAGINKYSLRWMWAFRWQVVIDLSA